MIKVVLLVHCDDCGEPVSNAIVCSAREPLVWEAAIEDIEYNATRQGWWCCKRRSLCPECNYHLEQRLDELAVAEFLQEREKEADRHE